MIKILLRARFAAMLAAMTPRKKNRPVVTKPSIGILILMGLLYLYLGAVFLFLFATAFLGMSTMFFGNGAEWAYFSMYVIIAFAIIFIGSIFATKSQLFEAKDNDLLLTMPIRPRDILASRMILLVLINFALETIVAIPAFAVWVMFGTPTVLGVIGFLLTFLALPFFCLAISCLFAWLIGILTERLPKKNLLTVAAFLAFFFVYMFFACNIDSYLTAFIENGNAVADSIGAILPLYWFGSAIGNGDPVCLILSLLIYLLPFVLAYYILSRTFIRIVTAKRGTTKKKTGTLGEVKKSAAFSALVRREFSVLLGSSTYMLNCGIAVPMALVIVLVTVFQRDSVFAALTQLELNDLNSILGALLAIVLCFLNSTGLFTAPSLSLEGKRIWLIRSMPIDSKDFLRAKIRMHCLITVPTNVICGLIVSIAYQPSLPVVLLLLVVPALHSVWAAHIGLICNLFHVNFDWINEAQVVKQGANILLAMLFTSLPVVVLTVIGIVLALFSYWLTLLFACGALGLGVWLTHRYLMRGGARRWDALM